MMRVWDLFCGLKGFSQAFEERSHEVFTVDILEKFKPDLVGDIRTLVQSDFPWRLDVILASPPCNCFSILCMSHYWPDRQPTEDTLKAIDLVRKTLDLIYETRPYFWFLENPTGMLRTVIGNPPSQVFYAQFGEDRLKPTDLWGRHPRGFRDIFIRDKNLLEYTRLKRGQRDNGTVAMSSSEERAKIPYKLSLEICKACETGLSSYERSCE